MNTTFIPKGNRIIAIMGFKNALAWNIVSQIGQNGINFLSMIILARLLTPADFGIIGMVTIFIAFSQMLVDSEFGGALLRKPEVTKLDYSTLFVYNIVVSIILYLILFFAAPLAADFYGKPQLIDIIRILSLTVVLHSFRVVQRVVIFRNMQFKQVAIISIVGGIISLGLAIWMAMNGYGYWALIGQQIANTSLSVIFLGVYNRYIPSLRFSYQSFKYQFSFGIGLLGADTLRTIANNINTNIIAKIMPLTSAGYFVQSSRLTNYTLSFLSAITDQTVFPVLARLEDKNEMRLKYFVFYQLSIVILSLVTVWTILLSQPLVRFILGDQWTEASWMVAVLSLGILPNLMQILCRNLLKIVAKTKRMFYLEIVKSVSIIVSLFATAYFGIYAIIWGYVITQWFVAIYYIYDTHNDLQIPITKQLSIVLKNAIRCCLIWSIIKLTMLVIPTMSAVIEIISITLFIGVLFILSMYLLRDWQLIALAKELMTKRHSVS